MGDAYLTSFLIGFSSMFMLHYLLEPTWKVQEPRSTSRRMLFNYTVGTLGISAAFLYLHPELWLDLFVSVAGAGSATMLAHGRDWLFQLIRRDRANGLVETSQDEA